MRSLQPGDTLGRYRVDRVVGAGGMGTVFAATDLRLGRTVALKVITGPLAAQPDLRDRFHHEATAMSRVDSPHVVQIHDHDEVDGVPFIVTQYVDGTDLATLLADRGPLPASTALQLCAQLARGLADVHAQGVLHRDVKPGNVLVRQAGTPQAHAYLCDFGIARADVAGGPDPTVAGAVAGTWTYLAPERLSGAPATPAADLYALGCVLWACLTGGPPYTGTEVQVALAHAQQPVPRLPGSTPFVADLNGVLAGLLAKDPAQRYADATVVRADLLRLERAAPPDTLEQAAPPPPPPPAAGPTVVRPRETPGGDPGTDRGRRRWPVVAGAAAALVLAGGGLAAWALGGGDEDPRRDGDDPVPSVAGDLDGDGRGDALVGVVDDSGAYQALQRIPSTGKQLGSPTPGTGEAGRPMVGHVDGDATADVVWFDAGVEPPYAVRVALGSGDIVPQTLEADEALFVTVGAALADVTGDGRDDLVLVGSTLDDRIGLHVAEWTGEAFAAPTQWWSGSDDVGHLDIVGRGDLDGDGDLELAALTHLIDYEAGTTTPELRLIDVEDGAMTVGNATPLGKRWRSASGMVGDLDGDGTSEVLVVNGARYAVGRAVVADGTFADPEQVSVDDISAKEWRKSLRRHGPPGRFASTVSDLDGDGDTDLLHLDPAPDTNEIWVQLAEDGALGDPVRWGSAPCATSECPGSYLFVR